MSPVQPDERPLATEFTKKLAVVPDSAPAAATTPPASAVSISPVAEGQSVSADVKPQIDFLWNTHKYLNDYIRFADTKAGFTVALASTVTGALFAAKLHELFLLTAPKQWTAVAWLSGGAFLALSASIACGVWTIRPRLFSKQSKGLLYWGGVSEHGSPEAFWMTLRGQSQELLAEHLAHHVFCLSELSRKKYFWVSVAMTSGALGGLLAALVLLFK